MNPSDRTHLRLDKSPQLTPAISSRMTVELHGIEPLLSELNSSKDSDLHGPNHKALNEMTLALGNVFYKNKWKNATDSARSYLESAVCYTPEGIPSSVLDEQTQFIQQDSSPVRGYGTVSELEQSQQDPSYSMGIALCLGSRCANSTLEVLASMGRLLMSPFFLLNYVRKSSTLPPQKQAIFEAVKNLRSVLDKLANIEASDESLDALNAQFDEAAAALIKAHEDLDENYQNILQKLNDKNIDASEKATLQAQLDERHEAIQADLATHFSKYALELHAKGNFKENSSRVLKFYLADCFKLVSKIMHVFSYVPILGVVAKGLEYLASTIEVALKGSKGLEEFHQLIQEKQVKSNMEAMLTSDKDGLDVELRCAAKLIKKAQDWKTKLVGSLRGGLEITNFALSGTTLILGGLTILGVLSGAALPIMASIAGAVGVLALGVAIGHILYQLGRWVIKQARQTKAEMGLANAIDMSSADRSKALRRLIKQDGIFTSRLLLNRLQSDNADISNRTEDFLNKTGVFTKTDIEILKNTAQDAHQSATVFITKKLNIA